MDKFVINDLDKVTIFKNGRSLTVELGKFFMTSKDFIQSVEKWQSGMHVQDAFPKLDDDTREFMLTGLSPEEWDELFGDDDEVAF